MSRRVPPSNVKDLLRADQHHDDTQLGSDAVEEAQTLLEDIAKRLGAYAEDACRSRCTSCDGQLGGHGCGNCSDGGQPAKRLTPEDVIRAYHRILQGGSHK